jgi:hypothetical protein
MKKQNTLNKIAFFDTWSYHDDDPELHKRKSIANPKQERG